MHVWLRTDGNSAIQYSNLSCAACLLVLSRSYLLRQWTRSLLLVLQTVKPPSVACVLLRFADWPYIASIALVLATLYDCNAGVVGTPCTAVMHTIAQVRLPAVAECLSNMTVCSDREL